MAYKGELMVRDDELAACMERARDLEALTMVHAENGDIIDLLVKRALARGDTSAINHALTRPEYVEAEATGRAATIAEHVGAPLFVVHVTCAAAAAEIEAAQQRGAAVYRRDLLPVPDQRRSTTFAGQASRAAATSARRRCATCRTTSRCGATCGAACSRASRPTTAHSTTSRSPAASTNFSLVPNGLALIQHRLAKLWDEGVDRAGSPDRSWSTGRARRSRGGSVCNRKGALAPGKDADVVVLDPSGAAPYGKAKSFMNVDYDLYEGETASASVRHTFSRGTLVYDRGEIKTEPGTVASSRGRSGPRVQVARVSRARLDPAGVIADLDELAARAAGGSPARNGLPGHPSGWRPGRGCKSKLAEHRPRARARRGRQHVGEHRRRRASAS